MSTLTDPSPDPEMPAPLADSEEALRQRTAQFETLLNQAPLGVYLIDAGFRIRDANPIARSAFGDIPDLIGRDFDAVIHRLRSQAYADELVQRFRHTLETGEPYFSPERREERRDGGVAEYYEWQINRIPLPEGGFGVVCYFRDVSAQVQARLAIAESEARFRALVTASSDVVYQMSPDWSEMRQLVGREFIADTREPSRTWLDRYIHTDDQPQVLAAIHEAIRTRSVFELEHRVFRVDGSLGWTLSRAVPILDTRGEVVEWFGTATDVTRRKEAEEAFSRQRRLYEAILTNTPDLAYVFDLNHRFIYANEGLLRMWGKNWEEAMGKSCLELGYEPWHAAMHDREIEQVIATRQPVRGEVPFTGTFGRRTYDYIFVPVLGPDGQVEAVAGTTRDVTGYRQAEEALREADRRKDEFLAMLAHELRNPLAPILNAVQIEGLLDPADPRLPRQRELIRRQVEQMKSLLDDLLDVSRITRNRIDLRPERLELAAILAEAVEASRPLIDAKRHHLSVTLPPETVWLEADRTRMVQVFTNLLNNAARYTDPGGQVRVTAEIEGAGLSGEHASQGEGARVTPAAHPWVAICVRDTGVGMTPAVLGHIFDLFTQADRSLARSEGGLGIGLTIARRLVQMHGGEIAARSAGPSQGAEFIVRLPIQAVARQPEGSAAAALQQGVASAAARRILVVDDNPDIVESLAELLELEGHQVFQAQDGPGALRAARTHRPEVILLDIGLPGKDGYEVARELGVLPDVGQPVLIAITGYGQAEDQQRSRAAGFQHHLIKPVGYEALQALLRDLPGPA